MLSVSRTEALPTRLRRVAPRLLATTRVLGEGAFEHVLEADREIGVEGRQPGGWVVDVRPKLLEVGVAIEYDSAGQHVIQHAPERVDVGAAVDVGTLGSGTM
jgi:hypothetical protein